MQDFMAARPQDWPCADEGLVLEKIRQEVSVAGRATRVAQLLAEDCSATAEEQCSSLCVRPEPLERQCLCCMPSWLWCQLRQFAASGH